MSVSFDRHVGTRDADAIGVTNPARSDFSQRSAQPGLTSQQLANLSQRNPPPGRPVAAGAADRCLEARIGREQLLREVVIGNRANHQCRAMARTDDQRRVLGVAKEFAGLHRKLFGRDLFDFHDALIKIEHAIFGPRT